MSKDETAEPCVVCLVRPRHGSTLCKCCIRSLQRVGWSQGDLIEWSAIRARRFAAIREARERSSLITTNRVPIRKSKEDEQ